MYFSAEERQAESRLFEIAPHEPELRIMAIVSSSVRAEDVARNEAIGHHSKAWSGRLRRTSC